MLESARLVSIIREVEEKEIISIIEGLVEEGIRWFEISLSDGENGMKCIRTSRKYFEGRDVYIGAGTVKKKEEIDVLSDMGVPYILTPGFDEQIVRYALEKKIEVLPGVLTPSEVQAAVNCGIHLAKLFPATLTLPEITLVFILSLSALTEKSFIYHFFIPPSICTLSAKAFFF